MPDGRNIVDQIVDTRVFGVPVGAAAITLIFTGVGEGLGRIVNRLLPGIPFSGPVSQFAVAALARNVMALRDLLTERGSDLMALGLSMSAIDNVVGLRAGVQRLLQPILGQAKGSLGHEWEHELGQAQAPEEFLSDVERVVAGTLI